MKNLLYRLSTSRSVARLLSILAFVALGFALPAEVFAVQCTCKKTVSGKTQYWCATISTTATAKCAEDGGTVAYSSSCRIPLGGAICSSCGSTVEVDIEAGTSFLSPNAGTDGKGSGTTCGVGNIDLDFGPNREITSPCTYVPDSGPASAATCTFQDTTSHCYAISSSKQGTATFSSQCTNMAGTNKAGTSGSIFLVPNPNQPLTENKTITLSVPETTSECTDASPNIPGSFKKNELGRITFDVPNPKAAISQWIPTNWRFRTIATEGSSAGTVTNLIAGLEIIEGVSSVCTNAFPGNQDCQAEGVLTMTINGDALRENGYVLDTICDDLTKLRGGPPAFALPAVSCELKKVLTPLDVVAKFKRCNTAERVLLVNPSSFQAQILSDVPGLPDVLNTVCPISN